MDSISILGSGWLGLPLARHLVETGYTVKASARSDNRLAELKAIDVDCCIVDIDLHIGDIQPFLRANTLIVNIPSKNVAGFSNLINEIKASEIRNLLFVSSTSVYQNRKMTMTESDIEFFSQSPLLKIEELFQRCEEIETTIVRFGGLIGYSRHPGRFFKPGRVIPNPDSPVNLIHRDDCIAIISRIIEQRAWGEVFNCCADTHPSKREFYSKAVASIGGVLPEFGPSDPEAGKLISNEKVKRLLNYEFRHPDLMEIDFEPST